MEKASLGRAACSVLVALAAACSGGDDSNSTSTGGQGGAAGIASGGKSGGAGAQGGGAGSGVAGAGGAAGSGMASGAGSGQGGAQGGQGGAASGAGGAGQGGVAGSPAGQGGAGAGQGGAAGGGAGQASSGGAGEASAGQAGAGAAGEAGQAGSGPAGAAGGPAGEGGAAGEVSGGGAGTSSGDGGTGGAGGSGPGGSGGEAGGAGAAGAGAGGSGAGGDAGASGAGSGGAGAGGAVAGASGAGGSGAGGSGAGGAGAGGSAGGGGGAGGAGGASTPGVRIYVSFVSHNEQPPHPACSKVLASASTYLEHRKVVKKFADGIAARPGVPWHMQSDVTFLDLVAANDKGATTSDTGGKNIIAYVAGLDPARIHTDAHHHPGGFPPRNYADVAFAIAALGGDEGGVVGGFLVYPINQSEVTALQAAAKQGMKAQQSAFVWKPTILWGGGSPGHTQDLEASGLWRIKSAAEVLVHDPGAPLPNIGPYNHIPEVFGTSVKDLIARAKAGSLPPGMYTATPVIDQCSLTEQNLGSYLSLIDELSADVASGLVVWKDLYGMVAEWKSVYGEQPTIFQAP